MKISDLAAEAVGYFATDKRDDGTEFVKTADDAPEWLRDLIREAHGGMFPDDWRYQAIRDVLLAVSDSEEGGAEGFYDDHAHEILNGLVDIYTHNLTGWLHSRNDRVAYVDQWVDDFGADGDTFQRLSGGQYMEYREILNSVLSSLEAELEERDALEDEPEAATA